MSGLRVLHIIFFRAWGGSYEHTLIQCNGLKRLGVDVILMCPSKDLFKGKLENDIQVISVDYKKSKLVRIVSDVVRVIRKKQIHVVHLHQSGLIDFMVAMITKHLCKLKIITTLHAFPNVDEAGGKRKWYQPETLMYRYLYSKLLDAVIPVSNAVMHSTINDLRVSKNKVIKIINAIELNDFIYPLNRFKSRMNIGLTNDHTLVIGTVARLCKLKRIEDLIVSFARVLKSRTDIGLLIVGDGPLKQELERLVESLNISNHIVFTGFREDISDLLGFMDVFVLPSQSEGLPRSVMEAMASGKPVIATDTGGVSDAVVHGKTGYLFEIGDVEALTNRIIELIENDGLRLKMSIEARRIAKERFDGQRLVDETMTLYKNIVNPRLK
jgi:glycosyltransferase involved in cell wall biosynthesis